MEQLTINWDEIIERRRNPKPARAQRMATQVENIERVKNTIADYVIAFFLSKQVGDEFHDQDLWQFVNARHRCAPASPRRIMAVLAKEGRLGYVVKSRADSLFSVTALPESEVTS
jgi:hypothetical protein